MCSSYITLSCALLLLLFVVNTNHHRRDDKTVFTQTLPLPC